MDDHFQKLTEYLLQQQKRGEPPAATRETLIRHGWDAGMVDQGIASLTPPAAASRPIQLPEPQSFPHKDGTAEPEPQTYQPYGTQTFVGHGAQPGNSQTPSDNQDRAIGSSIPRPTAKYGVLRALADSVAAIRRNPVPFISASSAAVGIAIGLILISDRVIYGIISLEVMTSDAASFIVFLTILLSSFVSFLITMAAYSLIQFVSNSVVYEGGEGRKPTLRHIAEDARKRLVKLLLANFLVGLVAIGPVVFLSNIFFALSFTPLNAPGTSANAFTLLLWIAALIWLLLVILRYALAPIAAMFEPDTSVVGSLRRSRQLLADGGQWFIGKLLLLVLASGIILSTLSGETVRAFDSKDDPLINVALVVLELLINGALVMLYRNRRLVKDS